jgi:hypothetical protein
MSVTFDGRAVRDATSTLAELDPEIATKTACRNALASARQRMCAELMAQPSHYEMVSLRLSIATCDRGLGAIEGTGCALEALRLGVLLREAGASWQGSIPVVERQIKELQARRDDAQGRLDAALRETD